MIPLDPSHPLLVFGGPYSNLEAAAAMRRHGHANGYARTLLTGLWPSLDILPPAEREAAGKRLRARTLRIGAPAGARSRARSETGAVP